MRRPRLRVECSLFGASLLFSVGGGTNPGLPAPQSLRAAHGWDRSLQRLPVPTRGRQSPAFVGNPSPGDRGSQRQPLLPGPLKAGRLQAWRAAAPGSRGVRGTQSAPDKSRGESWATGGGSVRTRGDHEGALGAFTVQKPLANSSSSWRALGLCGAPARSTVI